MRKIELAKAMKALGELYDKQFSELLIDMWFSVLHDVTDQEFVNAIKAYVTDPKNVFFPKPAQILGLAKGVLDVESQASLIADNVFYCLRSYGTDQIGEERAKSRMGDVGWAYIKNGGGWATFVQSIKDEADVPILKSQARKAIMGLLELKRSNRPIESDPIAIERAQTQLSALGVSMKTIDIK